MLGDLYNMDIYQETDVLSSISSSYEKSAVTKFLINHSFNLVFSKYQDKFQNQQFEGLNLFIQQLFTRLRMSLMDFQRFLILISRYLSTVDIIHLSPKQFILGLMMKCHDREIEAWQLITGLKVEQIDKLLLHFNVNNDLLKIDYTEFEKISFIWKKLIYSKFQII